MWIIIIVILIVVIGACTIKIVPQSYAYVIERLGVYDRTIGEGVNILIPLVDNICEKVSLKEQVIDFEPQPVITKDNVTMQIDTVVYFKIGNPKLFAYGVNQPIQALETLTSTTLRNIIGELELDETLTSRDIINSKMKIVLDEATVPWGIKVHRVEVKNIVPPRDIQEAMEKQMRAERERREAILRAEGEKTASILRAEGAKEAALLEAEAKKISTIKEAEAKSEAIRLNKEAEADGIVKIKKAESSGIQMLNKAGLNYDQIMLAKSYNAFEKAADGQATKIIIPSEIQSLASTVTSIKETITEPNTEVQK